MAVQERHVSGAGDVDEGEFLILHEYAVFERDVFAACDGHDVVGAIVNTRLRDLHAGDVRERKAFRPAAVHIRVGYGYPR